MYRFACRTLMLAACILATGVAGLGVGAQSAAQTAPVPDYYWCPGQPSTPHGGPTGIPTPAMTTSTATATAPTTAATTPDPSSKVPCLTIPVLRRRPRLPVAAHSAR